MQAKSVSFERSRAFSTTWSWSIFVFVVAFFTCRVTKIFSIFENIPENIDWPVREFPATQRETRGSPALCVSGKFQGNQRVFGAPFWQLSSFPESESWSGSRLGQNLRQNRGNRQIYRVFSRYTRDFSGMPAKHRSILTVRLILGPNQPQTRLRARKNGWFPWKVERKREGAVEKHGKETRQGARGNIRTA